MAATRVSSESDFRALFQQGLPAPFAELTRSFALQREHIQSLRDIAKRFFHEEDALAQALSQQVPGASLVLVDRGDHRQAIRPLTDEYPAYEVHEDSVSEAQRKNVPYHVVLMTVRTAAVRLSR